MPHQSANTLKRKGLHFLNIHSLKTAGSSGHFFFVREEFFHTAPYAPCNPANSTVETTVCSNRHPRSTFYGSYQITHLSSSLIDGQCSGVVWKNQSTSRTGGSMPARKSPFVFLPEHERVSAAAGLPDQIVCLHQKEVLFSHP